MHIAWFQIQNIRNLANLDVQPSPRLNVFIGPNASGKTSILEGIYMLSRARSFRTTRISEVITHQKPSLLVTAGLKYKSGNVINTGIEKGLSKTAFHFNGEAVKKISAQAQNTPLILITPDAVNLVTGPPKQRRSWLDWAMFHVERTYLEDWRNYHRALRQRNRLLNYQAVPGDALAGWEYQMAEIATRITDKRRGLINKIQENLDVISNELLVPQSVIGLEQGWPAEQELLTLLQNNREMDRDAGYTRYGIQSSDLLFRAENRNVSAVCSRGQIKRFLISLFISQARTLEQLTGERPLILIDDYRSEIDSHSRRAVLDLLWQQETQAFFTTTETEGSGFNYPDVKKFHVEHGNVVEVVK